MKPLLLRNTTIAACAAMVALLASATAAPVAPPVRPAPKPPGPIAQALTSMVQELGAATPSSMPLPQRMDALMNFKHSPATAARLEKIYGGTPAWTLSRLPASAGTLNYRGVLAPLRFTDQDGSSTEWAAFPIDFAVGSDGGTVSFSGAWPQASSSDKTLRLSMRELKLAGQQRRSADNLWFGNFSFDVASVAFDPVAAGPRFTFDGIHGDTSVTDQQSRMELGYQLAVRRIAVGAEGVDNFKLATRVTGIDRQTMKELQAYGESQAGANPAASEAEQRAALMPMFKAMTRGAIRSGTALEIDELSASFHGQTVRASGRVALDGAVDADADSAQALLKKLVVKLHVTAPMALLREVSNVLAEIQVKAKNKGAANPREVAQLAGTMNDIVLGKMISSGFVKVEGDNLVSDIEFNGGTGGLRVNGKATALPAMPGAKASATGPVSMLPARRIDASCKLPDYPQDVIAADLPLSLTMRLVVKANGSVSNVTVATPSIRPDYDQAVLAAAIHCKYAPVLRNGDPVDAPVAWKVTREAGSTHP